MHTDEIIEAVGEMSRFQILLTFVILGPKMLMVGGMLMMSFAAVAPDQWWCLNVTDKVNETDVVMPGPANLKYCPSNTNGSQCIFVYSQERHTIIDEWNLLCDKKEIPPTITAVQMGGVLIGALLAGHLADSIGRKKTYYLSMVLHAAFNLVAAFSVSWQMFMAIRFFIGVFVGGLLCVYFTYYMEFVGPHWRPITGAIPFWALGEATFALITWIRPNWSEAHIIIAAIHIPFFLGWFFVPESLRWLAVHGRLTKAENVVDKMVRYNRREKPANTGLILRQLAEEEQSIRDADSKYSYIDIYRGWKICLTSIVIQSMWFFISFVFYGMSFGVGRLTGSLYLNIFLIAMVDVPGLALSYFLNNRIGRRWTGVLFFALAVCGSFAVAAVSRLVPDVNIRGPVTTMLALICRFGVASAWCGMQVHVTETYPTPIRNLGYGAASVAARAGSIISPFAFVVGSGDDITPPFLMVGSAMFVCLLLTLTLKETLGVPLEDTTISIARRAHKTGKESNATITESTPL